MLDIKDVRACFTNETIFLTEHLLTRMRQRDIRFVDLKQAIFEGEIIEQYPTDYPFPSCLINSGKIHIVCSINDGCLYIITAYRPTLEKWEADGKKRKGEST